ncbi:MAG: GAF domain-containing sensor histidine kinase [Gemmatimonadota bacterium]|nr:GAF domain-containing sensor histidine kinase [Gemmatimonadota bacterium]
MGEQNPCVDEPPPGPPETQVRNYLVVAGTCTAGAQTEPPRQTARRTAGLTSPTIQDVSMSVPENRQFGGTRETPPEAAPATSAGRDSALQFLSRASQCLAESLDYESTLLTVAGMALPHLGSWCIVDVVGADGSMRRLGVIHPDPLKQEHATRLKNSWPPHRDDPLGLPSAVRSGASQVIAHVPDDMLVAVARGEENLRDLRALGIGSLVIVPLVARDHVLGAITFVSADVGHQYNEADLGPAEDLAARCAMALDNARLYTDVQQANREVDEIRTRAVEMNERLLISSVRQQELADEAREANQAKSQFLANMSHELRTPLTAIVGYTDLLELEIAGPLTAKQREYLARIQVGSRHLIGLIEDILDIAKVEAGRMQLNQEILAADGSIADAISLIEPQATAAGVTVETRLPEEKSFYLGDGDRVRQILVVLLSNGLKFTEPGGTVVVSCGTSPARDGDAKLAAAGPWTFLRVEDTGIGIPAAAFSAVFEPFVQVDAGNTRKRGGTGLGLAIARELARRMGGDLTVRSVEGEGSCFTAWLPGAAPPEDGAGTDQ